MAELAELHLIVVWFCNCVAQICPKYVYPNIVDVGYSVADSKSHRGSSASLLGVALLWFSKCSYSAPCARGPSNMSYQCTDRLGSISLCVQSK